MFSKLALRNVRRSFRDYGVYLLTLTFGVCLFYVFNSLETQAVFQYLGSGPQAPTAQAIRELELALDAALPLHLALDLSGVTFMDSSGIGLITGRFRMVHDKGGCVYAVHVNETIDRILLMSGIYRILKKMDSLDAIKKEMVKGGYYE